MTGAVLHGTTSVGTATGAVLHGTTNTPAAITGTPTGAVLHGTTEDLSSFKIDYQIGPELTAAQLESYVNSFKNVDSNSDGGRNDVLILEKNGTATVDVTDNDLITFDAVVINQPGQFGTSVVIGNSISYSADSDFTGLDVVSYTLKRNGVSVATADLVVGVFDTASTPVTTTPGGSTAAPITYPLLDELRGCDADMYTIRQAINTLIRHHNKIASIKANGLVMLREDPPPPDEEAAKRVNH